ncbi:MAG: hypothetical protein F6J97_25050 [Leptolyngbya sp. SIO4C1]|nr:hypothetical protein [Leptolyngbya sp. SIO4C1]
MPKDQSERTALTDQVAQNPGARMAKTKNDPMVTQEEAKNAVAGKGPNAAGEGVPSTVEDQIPSSAEPEASDLPTGNAPYPSEDQA